MFAENKWTEETHLQCVCNNTLGTITSASLWLWLVPGAQRSDVRLKRQQARQYNDPGIYSGTNMLNNLTVNKLEENLSNKSSW